MSDPKPRKWITWELPQKYLDDMSEKEEHAFCNDMRIEMDKALEDMLHKIPVSFKFTNLPKDY